MEAHSAYMGVGSNEQMKLKATGLLIILISLTTDIVGQGRTVLYGIATDGHRNRLVGINAFIKGTPVGKVTDICGQFSFPIGSDDFTLVFQGMSYDDTRTYEIELSQAEVTGDTLVFQLGHFKVSNPNCGKVNKRIQRRVIE